MPGSRMEESRELSLIADMAKKAEAAKRDAVFFGGIVGAEIIPGSDPAVVGRYEPITSIGGLSGEVG
jgi:hypothetical protein